MFMARVVGNVWSTQKHPPLTRGKLLLLEPILEDRTAVKDGHVLAALDTVGAGEGEIVLYVTSGEAPIPWKEQHPELDLIGVDAAIVAIVDGIQTAGETS